MEERAEDISLPVIKKEIWKALVQIYPKSNCGDFTQGLMELGATICLPGGMPKCEECPVKENCGSFQNGTVREFPLKKASKTRKQEQITVLALVCNGQYAIRQRKEKGLLAGLWEYPNVPERLTPEQAVLLAAELGAAPERMVQTAEKTHIFTHIEWQMQFYLILCKEQPSSFLWADEDALCRIYAIPAAFWLPFAVV
jgi:A/G-specific adenine glycosylase